MDIDNVRTGDVRPPAADPRTRLAQEKFFTQRPKPLERWLWKQRVPAAAERVFWFHWSEGARNGDWCSQFSLHFIAQQCEVDTSTVTRAYQVLRRLGLVRRTDPGRDVANPFEQATAITEVLLPAGLFAELQASPNRPTGRSRVTMPAQALAGPAPADPPKPSNPHAQMDIRERRARIKFLSEQLSPTELARWHKALCSSAKQLDFDPDTRVPAELQAEIQQYLGSRETPKEPLAAPPVAAAADLKRPRRLSVFEVARLRHGLQKLACVDRVDELTREVLWSIEAGALRTFGVTHAINIALKKVREGQWSRPHRMPPNWLRKVSEGARPETCNRA